MSLPYQLSKIGKEKRKSGLFRLCRRAREANDSVDITPDSGNPWKSRDADAAEAFPGCRPNRHSAPTAEMPAQMGGRKGGEPGARSRGGGGAIKKLPQVGQEPVEAVESGHSSPDAPYDNQL